MGKKALCLVLAVLLVCFSAPAAFASTETEIHGKCGSYAGYTLDTETGTLTVYMVGGAKSAYMDNYENGSSPFYGNTAIKHVVITAWIWNVGSEAFQGCTNLETVSFAFTVKEIGAHAFDGCDNAVFSFEGTQNGWNDVTFGEGNNWKNDPARVLFTMQSLDRVSAVFPQPKAGEKVKLNTELQVGSAEKYEAQVICVTFQKDGATVYLKDGDVLNENTEYAFEVAFIAKDGYAVEDDTVFEINGEALNAEYGTVTLTIVPKAFPSETPQDGEADTQTPGNRSDGPFGLFLRWFRQIFQFFKKLFKK